MVRVVRVLVCASVLAMLLPGGVASAHGGLPRGEYGCLSADREQHTGKVLHIRADQKYAFKKLNGDLIGNAGAFRHPSDAPRINFTSGYLDNQGWAGTHSKSNGFHTVTLKRDGVTRHCEPQNNAPS